MTIHEAICITDTLKPNGFESTEKIKWLSVLDGIIKSEIIDTHEGGENVVFEGYNEASDLNTVLLVPAPYDEIYLRYLEAQIDYSNHEYAKYNNSRILYNDAFTRYRNYYNRTHIPKGKTFKFF